MNAGNRLLLETYTHAMTEPGSGVTISSWVHAHAQHRPNKVALVFNGERRYTWREFSLNVNKLANVLISRGIRQNDKVASILPNSVEMVEL